MDKKMSKTNPLSSNAFLAEKKNPSNDISNNPYQTLITDPSSPLEKSEILEIYQKTNIKFIDPQFPPTAKSLAKNFSAVEDYSLRYVLQNSVFKRIEEIYPNKTCQVFDDINPNDITQGSIGDCYLLSGLSSLAEHPERIQNLFESKEYQPSGLYSIRMFDMGVPKVYLVDDFFPVSTNGNLSFAQPKIEKNIVEMWVFLIEKAWAKRFGTYFNIESGLTEEVLRDLTGAPCELLTNDGDHAVIWEKLAEGDRKRYIITAGTVDDENLQHEVNLLASHAYAIINVREIQTPKGLERLVNIRNPWGDVEWEGDWSDNSPLWTPELKQLLGWVSKDDGNFWMRLEDFLKYFASITICKIDDNFHYENLEKTQENNQFSVFKVNVFEGGDTYFILTLDDVRNFENKELGYSPIRVVIVKKHEERYERVTGTIWNSDENNTIRDNWIQIQAGPGEYFVYIEVNWNQNYSKKFGFSAYSASPISLSDVTSQELDFIDKVYNLPLALSQGSKINIEENVNLYQITFNGINPQNNLDFEGVFMDIIENKTQHAPVHLQVVHDIFINARLVSEYSGKSYYDVVINPGQIKQVPKFKENLQSGSKIVANVKKIQ